MHFTIKIGMNLFGNKLLQGQYSITGLLIIAALQLAVQAAPQDSDQQDFDVDREAELLCKNKQSDVRRISQVKSIIDYLKSNKDFECPSEFRQSILDLEETITRDTNDVCNKDKVQQIRHYHERYIAVNGDTSSSALAIPKSLKNFFLAYGLRVSYICKKNMINSLLIDPHELLDADDFKAMDLWTNKSGSLMEHVIGAPVDYDDLVLASDLNYLKADENVGGKNKEKLFIQSATGKLIRKIQAKCERRFKPIYDKLIMPLVELSNLGYNFQGEELERELNEIKTNKEVNQWYRLVYLCESLSDMEFLGESEADSALADQKAVRILTKQEADELKAQNRERFGLAEDEFKHLKQIDYKLEGLIPIDDLVLEADDKNLAKLVRDFDAKKREAERIRNKVFKKMTSFVSNMLKQKQIKFVTDFFKKKLFDGQATETVGPKDDMVFAIDEFVSQGQDSSDLPVAGFKDYVKRVRHNAVYYGPSGAVKKTKAGSGYWNMGRIFWYTIASLTFSISIALFITAMTAIGR